MKGDVIGISKEEYQATENYIDYLKQCISVYESKNKQHAKDYLEYEETLKANDFCNTYIIFMDFVFAFMGYVCGQ